MKIKQKCCENQKTSATCITDNGDVQIHIEECIYSLQIRALAFIHFRFFYIPNPDFIFICVHCAVCIVSAHRRHCRVVNLEQRRQRPNTEIEKCLVQQHQQREKCKRNYKIEMRKFSTCIHI